MDDSWSDQHPIFIFEKTFTQIMVYTKLTSNNVLFSVSTCSTIHGSEGKPNTEVHRGIPSIYLWDEIEELYGPSNVSSIKVSMREKNIISWIYQYLQHGICISRDIFVNFREKDTLDNQNTDIVQKIGVIYNVKVILSHLYSLHVIY